MHPEIDLHAYLTQLFGSGSYDMIRDMIRNSDGDINGITLDPSLLDFSQLVSGPGNLTGPHTVDPVLERPNNLTPYHTSLKPGVHRYDPTTRAFYLSLQDFFPASLCSYSRHQNLANADHCLRIKGAQTTQDFLFVGYSDMYHVSQWECLIAGEQYQVRLFSDADDLADCIQNSNIPILSA